MSSVLAIAGVTAVLRDLLNDGIINHNVSGILGSTVTVSALPPDRILSESGTESAQLSAGATRDCRRATTPGGSGSQIRRWRSTCITC